MEHNRGTAQIHAAEKGKNGCNQRRNRNFWIYGIFLDLNEVMEQKHIQKRNEIDVRVFNTALINVAKQGKHTLL